VVLSAGNNSTIYVISLVININLSYRLFLLIQI
jgi:hypothetical protein